MSHMRMIYPLLLLALVAVAPSTHAEEGYDLWLRYPQLPSEWVTTYRA